MKAIDCVFHRVCRYQQAMSREQKRAGIPPDLCWGNEVDCDDQKADMDKRCSLFRQKGWSEGTPCRMCRGTGKVTDTMRPVLKEPMEVRCPACDGKGVIPHSPDPEPGGSQG